MSEYGEAWARHRPDRGDLPGEEADEIRKQLAAACEVAWPMAISNANTVDRLLPTVRAIVAAQLRPIADKLEWHRRASGAAARGREDRMNRAKILRYRLRQQLGPRGIHVYRAASNTQPPYVKLNRYPSGVIGVGFRIPGHRVLSIVWRQAR